MGTQKQGERETRRSGLQAGSVLLATSGGEELSHTKAPRERLFKVTKPATTGSRMPGLKRSQSLPAWGGGRELSTW